MCASEELWPRGRANHFSTPLPFPPCMPRRLQSSIICPQNLGRCSDPTSASSDFQEGCRGPILLLRLLRDASVDVLIMWLTKMVGAGPMMKSELVEEFTRILFGEEIGCLGSDGFDSSKERRIYMEVLYENEEGNFNNASSKIMNIQSGGSLKQSDDSESSGYTLSSSLKESLGTLRQAGNDLLPVKKAINSTASASVSANPNLQCRVVESFGNGVLPSLYFDNFQILSSSSDDYVSMLSRCEGSNHDGNKVKVLEKATYGTSKFKNNRSAASKLDLGCVEVPVEMFSYEDFSSSTPSLMVQNERVSEENIPSKEDLQVYCSSHPGSKIYKVFDDPDDCIVNVLVHDASIKRVSPHVPGLDALEVTMKDIPGHSTKNARKPAVASLEPFSTSNLTFQLRSFARQLLKDADWEVRFQKRKKPNSKTKIDYYYSSPEGSTLSSLPKAWVACGSTLLSTQNSGTDDETGRVWAGIDEFWSELADVLAHKKLQHLEKAYSLLHRWRILDPFVAMLFISMKVRALKQGMTVKAARSKAVILSNNNRLLLASKGVDKLENHASPDNISSTVQSALSDSRLQMTECSSVQQGLPSQDAENLKRKRRQWKLLDRTSHSRNRTCKRREPRNTPKVISNASDFNGKDQTLSPASDMLFQETMIIDGSSKPDCLNPHENFPIETNGLYSCLIDKSSKPDCFNLLENSSIQTCGLYLNANDESNTENDSLNESTIDQEVHSKNTPCRSGNAEDHKERMGNALRDGNRSPSFKETHEIGDGSLFKPIGSYYNTDRENEDLAKVKQQSKTDSGNIGNVFMVNLAHKHPVPGREILLFYPQQTTVCYNKDGYCREELVGHFVLPRDLGGNMQQDVQSFICQSSNSSVAHLFGLGSNSSNGTGLPFQKGSIDFDSQNNEMIKKIYMHGMFKKSEKKSNISEAPFTNNSRKKNKNNIDNVVTRKGNRIFKVPELEVTEVSAKGLKLNANCVRSFPFSMDHRKNGLHYLDQKDKVNNSRADLYSEEIKKSCSHVKPKEESFRMETDQFNSKTAQNNFNGLGACVSTLEVVENLSSCYLDKRFYEGLTPDHIINKELGEVMKTKLGRKRGSKKINSCVIEKYENLISDDAVESQDPQNDSSDEHLMSGPGNSQGVTRVKKTEECKKSGRKKKHKGQVVAHNLLVSPIVKTMHGKSGCKILATKGRNFEPEVSRKREKSKRSCRFVQQHACREGQTSVNVKRAPKGTRTVLHWLIKMGVISLSDVMQYQTPINNAVVKEGRVTKAGILCKCCKKIFSVTNFKRHAGGKLQNASLNLFLKSGKPYIWCQLQAWYADYKLRKDDVKTDSVQRDENDDICRLCADGGVLICCDSCPSTYHQACLYLQELPEGSWYCPSCSCAFCGCALNAMDDSASNSTIECSQCEHRYHEECINERIRCDAVGSNMWFCGQKCLQVYTGLYSHVGVTKCTNDGFSWTLLKCNHDDQKFNNAQKTALLAECNSKLAIALSIMEESFLPMLDPRTGNNMIHQFFYNWGIVRSNTSQVNYHGFYTVALEKDDELFSVASIRVHGVTLAEMPLIATCIGQRRKGMCRRLVHVIEEMLKSLKVEMLVLPAIPCLIDTWISAFGFKHINDDDKKKLSRINLMVFPGATLLKKILYEGEGRELGKEEDNSPLNNYPPIEVEQTVDLQQQVAVVDDFEEEDPYLEALNLYKSSLEEINITNILRDT